jgi:ADP-heptose:LPS heptosyltransferase
MADQDRLRILVIRADRVGDVVLSTPVFSALRRHYPEGDIFAMVREGVAPLLRGLPSLSQVLIYDPMGRHRGWKGFLQLVKEFRELKIDISVCLQTERRIAAALFWAGVRYRVGPLSKPHSYMFYNRGLRQRRSGVEMHEADYNLQLLQPLGIRAHRAEYLTQVSRSSEVILEAEAWLRGKGWDGSSTIVAVHPGMGGSALNWPEENYVELAATLLREGHFVLATGGPTEEGVLERFRRGTLEQAGEALLKTRWLEYGGREAKGIDFLGALLSKASVAVAPSTGPLHVAVAVGTPVVTFYPPVKVMSALRWGPYLQNEDRASVLVPDVYCGQSFKCRGSLCNYYPCMRQLTVEWALEQVRRQLANSRENPA